MALATMSGRFFMVTALVVAPFQRTESPNCGGSFLQCRSLICHLLHDILDLDSWTEGWGNLHFAALQFVPSLPRDKGNLLFHFSHLFANHVGLRTLKLQILSFANNISELRAECQTENVSKRNDRPKNFVFRMSSNHL